jgi:hypothetical protein
LTQAWHRIVHLGQVLSSHDRLHPETTGRNQALGRKVREGQRSASRSAGTGPLMVQTPSWSFFLENRKQSLQVDMDEDIREQPLVAFRSISSIAGNGPSSDFRAKTNLTVPASRGADGALIARKSAD